MHPSTPPPSIAQTTLTVLSQRATVKVPSTSTELSLSECDEPTLRALAAKRDELQLTLQTLLSVSGPESAQVARTANFFFSQMLSELNQFLESVNNEYKVPRRSPSSSDLPDSLLIDMGAVLNREPSLLTDVSNADALLNSGIDAYVNALRKLLRAADAPAPVEITLNGFSFSVLVPGIESSLAHRASTHNTVGNRCFSLFCCACIVAHRLVARAVARARRPKPSLEQPLLSSQDESKPHMACILKNITVSIKPGRLTLVLGPPGCGKTSFLKALSGGLLKVPGHVEFAGGIFYNGRSIDSLTRLPNWVAYASQEDEHIALLTTRETLTHAFKCRKRIRFTDPGVQQALRARLGPDAVDKLNALCELDVDVALAVLGLSRCADTVLGNDTLKGVSGGERRRITLGEMLETGTSVLCLDEISTGLDSAATFDICQYLHATAQLLDQCIVVALLQPPPEVIALFDDIIVLAEGQVIFHGERSRVVEYFDSLGFRCPPRKDLGDYIQELPTYNGAAFALDALALKEMGLPPAPASPEEFAERWRASDAFKAEDAEVHFQRSRALQLSAASGEPDIDRLPENPWYVQLGLAMRWFMVFRLKDRVKIRAKIIQNLFMGLLIGTLFYKIRFDEAYQKNMLFFQVLQFSAQSSIPEVQQNARSRNVYYRHVDQGFYKAWHLALASLLTMIPFVCVDVAIFGNLIYFLTGLAQNVHSYSYFVLVSVLYGCTMQSIMGIFPYLVRNEDFAVVCAAMVLITMILMSGVVATEDVIPVYLKPLFYVNPLAWAFRAVANIEFLSPEYDVTPCHVSLGGKNLTIPMQCGHFFLSARQIRAGWEWVYLAIAVLSGFLVFFWLLQAWALSYVRFERPRISRNSEKERQKKWLEHVHDDSTSASRSGAALIRQESIAVEQATLVVHELGYSIRQQIRVEGVMSRKPVDVDLLKNITMWALPGRMLALMGSSGAGKTTLLDVLAGIKTVGTARGQIYLNGRPINHAEFTKIAGYVQQFGVHSLTSTIRESLEFSAALRLSASFGDRASFVTETLKLLELDEIESQLTEACSLEQNKRLTLGVELVANPSIVFADEPTSGLDARAASIVMRVLQKVARSGRVVVATIHQPSISIFQRFDDLLLLKRGGEVAFFGELGPNAVNLIAYFEAIPGVPKCPDGANPAAWMLDTIGGGTGVRQGRPHQQRHEQTVREGGEDNDDDDEGSPLVEPSRGLDFAQVYRLSELKKRNDQRLKDEFGITDGLLRRKSSSMQLSPVKSRTGSYSHRSSQFNQPFFVQLRLLCWRNFVELWRSPEFSFQRLVVTTVFGLMFTAIFFQQPLRNTADVQSHVLCVSFSSTLVGMFCMMTIIPFAMNRRALFYRERGAGMYHGAVWAISWGLAELPFLFITSVLAVNVVYWGVGFNSDATRYAYFAFIAFLYMLFFAYLGMMFASILPEPLSAQLAGVAFFGIGNIFAGVAVPAKLIPKHYLFLHYGSPMRWFTEGALSTQFEGDKRIICNPSGLPVTTGLIKGLHLCTADGLPNIHKVTGVQVKLEDFIFGDFLDGFHYENRWWDLGVLCAWIMVVRTVATMATVWISFDRR